MRKSIARILLLWSLFFLISLGLGYPVLKRYDPRQAKGLSDTSIYYQLVVNDPRSIGRPYMRDRVLIPFVAKPFYLLAKNRLDRVEPVFFGLLIATLSSARQPPLFWPLSLLE